MADFYVYTSSMAGYSKIHRADCPHCRDGIGPSGLPVGPGDQFIAAGSFAEAQLRAKALGHEPVACKVCNPS